MPQVLTANDYYPGGMPMPQRICSTQTTVVTAVLRDDPFNSGTASYTGTNGATLSNSSGTLLVTKLSSATDSWGARTPAHTLTAGVEYRLSYLLTLGGCSAGRETRGWRVVDAAGNDIAGNIVLGTGPFNVNGTFTVPVTGTYYIEFYRNTSSTGTCSFTIDSVLLISNTYLTVKVCGTPAEQYAWGHNGQYKDDEIYGAGNTYTAEYWEYDARLMRRWNTDPLAYEWQSPYAAFNNNPIFFADPAGLVGTNPSGSTKEKGGGSKKGMRKKNSNGTIPVEKDDEKGTAGATAPNGGTVQQGGGVEGGEAYCQGCGPNGENVYGIPQPDASQAPAGERTYTQADYDNYDWGSRYDVNTPYDDGSGGIFIYQKRGPAPYQTKGIDFAVFRETVQRDHLPMLEASAIILELSGGFLLGSPGAAVGKAPNFIPKGNMANFTKYVKGIFQRLGRSAAKEVSAEGAVWAQRTFSGTFSSGGKFAGMTVDEVAVALRSGTISATEVPINVVV